MNPRRLAPHRGARRPGSTRRRPPGPRGPDRPLPRTRNPWEPGGAPARPLRRTRTDEDPRPVPQRLALEGSPRPGPLSQDRPPETPLPDTPAGTHGGPCTTSRVSTQFPASRRSSTHLTCLVGFNSVLQCRSEETRVFLWGAENKKNKSPHEDFTFSNVETKPFGKLGLERSPKLECRSLSFDPDPSGAKAGPRRGVGGGTEPFCRKHVGTLGTFRCRAPVLPSGPCATLTEDASLGP